MYIVFCCGGWGNCENLGERGIYEVPSEYDMIMLEVLLHLWPHFLPPLHMVIVFLESDELISDSSHQLHPGVFCYFIILLELSILVKV